jgi:hypothetical protein
MCSISSGEVGVGGVVLEPKRQKQKIIDLLRFILSIGRGYVFSIFNLKNMYLHFCMHSYAIVQMSWFEHKKAA